MPDPCHQDECPESHMADGSHAIDYEDSGICPWCGEISEERRRDQ